jgi:hypothetical protein
VVVVGGDDADGWRRRRLGRGRLRGGRRLAARGHRADGGGQLAGGHGPGGAGVGGRLGAVAVGGPVAVLGQQQHAGGGPGLADLADQLGHAGARHLGVDHQNVGLVGDHRLQGRGAVAGDRDHLEVGLGRQHHAKALNERIVVVSKDDPDVVPHSCSPREPCWFRC